MSLSDLASLGTFVSGAAVLVSLIFLYFQLRQLNAQVTQSERNQQASIRQGRAAILVELNLRAADFPSQFDIWRGNPVENETQRRQFINLALANFHVYEENFDQHQTGLLSDGAFKSFVRNTSAVMRFPGMRVAWKRSRERFGDDFVAFIDNIITETPAQKPRDNALEQFNAEIAEEVAGAVG